MDLDTGTGQDAADYCAALVRAEDRNRFLAAQFAAPPARRRVLALLAVNAEMARAARAAHEPILLRMRIQWWREALAAVLAGGPPPRQLALVALVRAHAQTPFVPDSFERLLAARERDFTVRPLAGIDDAVAHADDSAGSLALLALRTLGVCDAAADVAARSAGIAFDLAGMSVRAGFSLRQAARDHIAVARQRRTSVPGAARAVMLWVTAAEARVGAADPARPLPLLPLTLAWRAWRGIY